MAASSSRDTPLAWRYAEPGRGGDWTAALGSPRVESGTPPLMLDRESVVKAETSSGVQSRQSLLVMACLSELMDDLLVEDELLGG